MKKKNKRVNRLRKFFIDRSIDLEGDQHCFNKIPSDSLISLRFADGHTHHLLPGNPELLQELVEDLIASEGLNLSKPSILPPLSPSVSEVKQRPIILKNRQALGDILMMSAGIRDLKKAFPDWPIGVSTTAMHIWDHNPHIDRNLTTENAEIVEIGPSYLTNASNRDDRHFANAFRISIEEKLGISIPQGPIKPDIWMTEEEIKTPIIEPPYWIIVAGEKGDWTAKTYPFGRWQEIVSMLSDITFVQVGAAEHRHPPLVGKNVINLIGKTQDRETGIRDLFRLFYFAEGSMGLVSFQMHLAAAFGMPCVVIAGAREPARFTRYPNHQYLCTDGCLPCASTSACWHCNLEKTCPEIVVDKDGKKIPKCVDLIKVEDVLRAFNQLYEGGRLSLKKPRKPTLPNPIGKTKDISVHKVISLIPSSKDQDINPEELGFTWGGACITKVDWEFLKTVIKKYNIKTVLEFGTGLSTVLMSASGIKVISYETEDRWLKDLESKEVTKMADVRRWDGKIFQDKLEKFDLAIVDGPPGGESREFSTKIASEHSDIVLVHDAGRTPEREWQDKYLKEKFSGPGKGGTRFHLWVKKEIVEEQKKETEIRILESGNKLLRLLFNGRGEGGAENSTNWIMTKFIEKGWNVEYVHPSASPSGTFRRFGHPEVVTIGDLEALRRPCDVLLLYVNDWVWEINKEPVVMALESSAAKRKVMVVNYRLGEIGKIPWTQKFDEYIFLNSSLEDSFISAYMKSKSFNELYSFHTKVLPPPTDLTEFFETKVDYSGSMKIVRHSSQGDSKYSKDFNEKVEAILNKFSDAIIQLMPAPTFLDVKKFGNRVISHKRNDPSVKEFLAMGNLFWYDLPIGYEDQGPKVVMESQASGLPVIANNHSGPKSRVVERTGFLYDNFEESLELFEKLNNPEVREKIGRAAREHAKKEYDPNRWIDEIIEK